MPLQRTSLLRSHTHPISSKIPLGSYFASTLPSTINRFAIKQGNSFLPQTGDIDLNLHITYIVNKEKMM